MNSGITMQNLMVREFNFMPMFQGVHIGGFEQLKEEFL